MTTEQLTQLGFRNTGFGCVVRKTEISVWIVVSRRLQLNPVGVHMFHGAPAGAFWRNEEPLARCATVYDAKKVAERLFGIAGSGEQAQVIYEQAI